MFVATTLSGRTHATKIERCIVKNVSILAKNSAGLIDVAYDHSIIKNCQFEGRLYGTRENFSGLGGLVESTYGFDCDTPVQIEDCCVKTDLENCATCGGILNSYGRPSKCFFRGTLRSLRCSIGIQDSTGYGVVADCVCVAAEISCKKDIPISQP